MLDTTLGCARRVEGREGKGLHPFLINIGSFHLPTYGVLLVLAILGGIYTAIRLGRSAGLLPSQILDFCTWVILVALIGAKVLMILTDLDYFIAHPGEIFSISTLMAGGVFLRRLSCRPLLHDLVRASSENFILEIDGCPGPRCRPGSERWAPRLLQRRVRLRDAYNGSLGSGLYQPLRPRGGRVPLGIRLHPTQLYESLATLVIFGLLLWRFPHRKRDGDIFLTYLGLYAVARFFLEFLRGDEDRGFVFHHLLSTSQLIALLVLAGVAVVFIWRRFQGVRAGHRSRSRKRALGEARAGCTSTCIGSAVSPKRAKG